MKVGSLLEVVKLVATRETIPRKSVTYCNSSEGEFCLSGIYPLIMKHEKKTRKIRPCVRAMVGPKCETLGFVETRNVVLLNICHENSRTVSE